MMVRSRKVFLIITVNLIHLNGMRKLLKFMPNRKSYLFTSYRTPKKPTDNFLL